MCVPSQRYQSLLLLLAGVGSGENTNRQHVQGMRYETFRGLGRVVLQPTIDCTSHNRILAQQIDLNSTLTFVEDCPTETAVVSAHTEGLPAVRIAIPISGVPKDAPLVVARAYHALDTFNYLDDVQA